MASRKPQEAKAVLEIFSHHLTAVAVSVRKGHSIAFLGDTKGALHKVFHPIPIYWYGWQLLYKYILHRILSKVKYKTLDPKTCYDQTT